MSGFLHILERLLGLDRGFLSDPGELQLRFDPHWPGPLIGSAGGTLNWLGALIVVALLIVLLRPYRRPSRIILGLAVCGAVLWPSALLFTTLNVYSLGLGAAVIALIAWLLLVHRNDNTLLVVACCTLFGLLLSLLSGSAAWNITLAAVAALILLHVYRRDGRSTVARILLGTMRGLLLALVILILNNPVLTRIKTLVEPSVVAVMLDDSLSMKVQDAVEGPTSPSRLAAAIDLLSGDDQQLMRNLAKTHTLRFFAFDRSARAIGTLPGKADQAAKTADPTAERALLAALSQLQPDGQSTQVAGSLAGVLDALQGQRLAGVMILTDGRDTPTAPPPELVKSLKTYGVRVYPIAVGSDKPPSNIEVQSITVEDTAFKGDLVNVKAMVRATGYGPNHEVHLSLRNRRTGESLQGPVGGPVEKTVTLPDDGPHEEELLFKPDQVGPLEITVEAERQPGEIDYDDNVRSAQLSVLDAHIAVLYVEGYPRWEYRYIKNEMIRDKTVDISCLLTSADQGFAQEGDPAHEGFPGPITRFPETMEELMPYDVVLFGDVEPRQFTDNQLQLISDFVSRKGGGFGMIAGPQVTPAAYRNTPIEAILPVNITHVQPEDPTSAFDEGFRPVLTREGADSSIFRFLADRDDNAKYLKNDLQPLFWYLRGVTPKPGVGIVYAEHPTDTGPDGRKAPLLVVSHFGAGRALFSGIDDSWRWRFYTNESVFDTYWVQQLRWLARGKKLGQRRLTFTADRDTYELGQPVRLRVAVLDPILRTQLPAELSVQVKDEKDRPVKMESLQKQAADGDYVGSFAADRVGRFVFSLPAASVAGENLDANIEVIEPRLELADARTNPVSLSSLASETLGQTIPFEKARAMLPGLIPSAARTTLMPSDMPLWSAPLTMILFMLLITTEWVLRKAYGML
jgi:uncharacterized membrane protein